MNPSLIPNRCSEAKRWAKTGATLNPGIMFTAHMGDVLYSYEVKPNDPTERLRSVK